MIPKKIFLTKGKGFHKNKLHSFELALREAGIHKCNLVKVSSIIPPHCKLISKKEGVSLLRPGEITYCVLSVCETNKLNEEISAAVGLAFSDDKDIIGYIAEGIKQGIECKNLKDYIENTAYEMFNSILKEKNNEQSIRKKSIVQTSKGKKDAWSTVVAAAVFIT